MPPTRISFSFLSALCLLCHPGFAQNLQVQYPRLGIVSFDPVLGSQGNERLHRYKGWYDAEDLLSGYIQDLEEASHGLIKQRCTSFIAMDFWPVKADGFQYTEAEYLAGQWHQPDGVDYNIIVRDYDFARRIDRGEFDEIGIWGGPYFGYWESTMAGPGAYWCNSSPREKIACSKLFVIMGWNYERNVELAVHSTGHRAESIMTYVYDGWNTDGNRTLWDRFGWNLGQTSISSIYGVGSVHFPPNGRFDYDYTNAQTVQSHAVDWMNNFPNLTGQSGPVSRTTWGAPWQRNYMKWFFQHMPHVAGRNQEDGYDRLNNWWDYIFNLNAYPESGGSHALGGRRPAAHPGPHPPRKLSPNSSDDWAPQVNENGIVAWYGFDGSDFEIYTKSAAGGPVIQITNNDYQDEQPRINRDGVLVWQAFDGTDYEIFTGLADGSQVTQITNNEVNDWHPEINNANRIVWDAWDGHDHEIFSSYADGSGLSQITDNMHVGLTKRRDDVWPQLNDNNRVVWFAFDGWDYEIFSSNADGTDLTQLTDNFLDDEYPTINAQGRVVWHSWDSEELASIYSADATGSNSVRLSEPNTLNWYPQINDSNQVTWMSRYESEDWEVLSGNALGGPTIRITDDEQNDTHPRIDSEGNIYWQGIDGEDWEIYMWRQGTTYQITNNSFDDLWVASNSGVAVWHAGSRSGMTDVFSAILVPGHATLEADKDELSASSGGMVHFNLDAGPSQANRAYWMAANFTNTFPGTLLPGESTILPLNLDALFRWSATHPNGRHFQGFSGLLDNQGRANATFDTLGSIPSLMVGKRIHVAYALMSPWDMTSNPVAIRITQ